VDIPVGFSLCNGSNGTPDLRDKFIVGAGDSYNPADTGGTTVHDHIGDSAHTHTITGGVAIQGGPDYAAVTAAASKPGTTDESGTLPPYYALAYIIKD